MFSSVDGIKMQLDEEVFVGLCRKKTVLLGQLNDFPQLLEKGKVCT
jgi:hypothetical protein